MPPMINMVTTLLTVHPVPPLHLVCGKDIALPCELSLSHKQSSPTPPGGGVPHMSLLLSSSLEEDASSSVRASSKDALSAGDG